MSGPEHTQREIESVQYLVDELVKRELLEVGELREVEDKLRDISQKTSRMMPPSEKAGAEPEISD